MSLSNAGGRVVTCWMFWMVSLLAAPGWLQAQDTLERPGAEVWLVTYGPGEVYWQRYGHNGIWIRDAELGLDHVFNFGFFDFEQENFFLRFLQGRMLYFSAAQPAQQEFSQYIDDRRSIRAQRLDLSEEQARVLAEHLVTEVQPRNRDYLYDYYTNNCSTRVRDALDLALGGQLQAEFLPQPAEQDWRDHTRRLTIADYWIYLGLELVLGAPVDRPKSRWDEFFIPEVLAEALPQVPLFGAAGAGSLVTEDVMIFESPLQPPPLQPANWWPRYLLLSALVLIAAWGLTRWVQPSRLAKVWLTGGGLAGAAMTFFWLFTDHAVAAQNWNLALFNPLWLLVWLGPGMNRNVAILVLAGAVVALFAPPVLLPQYNADVVAAFLPLNLAAALVLLIAARSFAPARQ